MIKIENIINYLENLYPLKISEKWDNVGLIFGNKNNKVNNIIVALDLTIEVFKKAILNNAELIIIHHPFIFEKTLENEFANAPYKKILYDKIINVSINVYVIHTNFDKISMAREVAKKLNFKNILAIEKTEYGVLATFNASINNIIKHIKKTFNFEVVTLNNYKHNNKISKIAIIPGAGDIKDIIKAHNFGAEVVVTSDLKWSTQLTANELNIKLISVSHSIEDVFVFKIEKDIQTKFKKIKVLKVFSPELIKL